MWGKCSEGCTERGRAMGEGGSWLDSWPIMTLVVLVLLLWFVKPSRKDRFEGVEAADRGSRGWVYGGEAIEEAVELGLMVLDVWVLVASLHGQVGGGPDGLNFELSSSGWVSTAAVVVAPVSPAPEDSCSEDNEGVVEDTIAVPTSFASTTWMTFAMFAFCIR